MLGVYVCESHLNQVQNLDLFQLSGLPPATHNPSPRQQQRLSQASLHRGFSQVSEGRSWRCAGVDWAKVEQYIAIQGGYTAFKDPGLEAHWAWWNPLEWHRLLPKRLLSCALCPDAAVQDVGDVAHRFTL